MRSWLFTSLVGLTLLALLAACTQTTQRSHKDTEGRQTSRTSVSPATTPTGSASASGSASGDVESAPPLTVSQSSSPSSSASPPSQEVRVEILADHPTQVWIDANYTDVENAIDIYDEPMGSETYEFAVPEGAALVVETFDKDARNENRITIKVYVDGELWEQEIGKDQVRLECEDQGGMCTL